MEFNEYLARLIELYQNTLNEYRSAMKHLKTDKKHQPNNIFEMSVVIDAIASNLEKQIALIDEVRSYYSKISENTINELEKVFTTNYKLATDDLKRTKVQQTILDLTKILAIVHSCSK